MMTNITSPSKMCNCDTWCKLYTLILLLFVYIFDPLDWQGYQYLNPFHDIIFFQERPSKGKDQRHRGRNISRILTPCFIAWSVKKWRLIFSKKELTKGQIKGAANSSLGGQFGELSIFQCSIQETCLSNLRARSSTSVAFVLFRAIILG